MRSATGTRRLSPRGNHTFIRLISLVERLAIVADGTGQVGESSPTLSWPRVVLRVVPWPAMAH
jgi:hypothetical protein